MGRRTSNTGDGLNCEWWLEPGRFASRVARLQTRGVVGGDVTRYRDGQALHKTGKQSLERHLFKIAKAAPLTFNKAALQFKRAELRNLVNSKDEAPRPAKANMPEME